MVAILAAALNSPKSATGFAISSSTESGSVNYCSADWKCYGPAQRGFQRADCSWASVEACGTNSSCPQNQVLVSACNKTCTGDGTCNGCAPLCETPTPVPTPALPPKFNEVCSENPAPRACEGEETYEKIDYTNTPSALLQCKKIRETGYGLFSCPSCGKEKLDACVNIFLGLLWKARCSETKATACGSMQQCPQGFQSIEEPCEKASSKTLFCCKKQE